MDSIVINIVYALILMQGVCSKVLYHYTDETGSRLIFRSDKIKSSTSGAFGPGVYLTSYSPLSKSRKEIAENNWGAATSYSLSKTKCVYEVDVSGAQKQKSYRDIYLYEGGDIVLSDINDWNIYDWVNKSAKVVTGKHVKHYFKSPCLANMWRKRPLVYAATGFPAKTRNDENGNILTKNKPNNLFFTENLTKRYGIIRQFARLKQNNKIYTYWARDGATFVKENTDSRNVPLRGDFEIARFR